MTDTIPIPCLDCGAPQETDRELADFLRAACSPDPISIRCEPCLAAHNAKLDAEDVADMRRRRALYAAGFVPARYQDTDPAQFCERMQRHLAYDFPSGHGLVIHGESGSRKTRFAYHVIRERLVSGLFRDAEWIRGSAMAELIEQQWCNEPLAQSEAKARIARLKTAGIVLLDDLDKMRKSAAALEFLDNLVDIRTSNGLPMIITTQVKGAELADALASRDGKSTAPAAIVRRIRDFCASIHATL